jgi:polyhydroxybutyrate depolymerase
VSRKESSSQKMHQRLPLLVRDDHLIFSTFAHHMKYTLLLLLLLFAPSLIFSQETLYETLDHDGLTREYTIHIPPGYNSDTPVPLMFSLHGYTSNNDFNLLYTGFNSIADTANFIVVYPLGTTYLGATHWNVGGFTAGSPIDDVGFLETLIDEISSNYSINPDRVYSTGMSNGGYMSFLLACQISSKIAAIASVTGSMTLSTYDECNPDHPTPVLQIHGTTDGTVPYEGGAGWSESIPDVLDYWINHNNCDTEAIVTPFEDIDSSDGSTAEHYLWNSGDNNVTTEHIKVTGGGHDWPGAWGNMDISASIEVWKFFMRFDINGSLNAEVNDVVEINNERTLIKIVDVLGRDAREVRNQILFYIFSDGTTEKRFFTE